MGTVYAFFADGFEEIEALTTIDTLRRAGLDVEIVSVTPDEIVVGAHDVSVLCDKNFENCDFFDAELLFLPGGMPGAAMEFALTIVDTLLGKEKVNELVEAMCVRR